MNEYIIISPSTFTQSRISIKSENKMFLDDVVMKISENCVIFEQPSMDFRGKTIKMTKKKENYYQNTCAKIDKEGKFYLEKENEQLIVRLWNKK